MSLCLKQRINKLTSWTPLFCHTYPKPNLNCKDSGYTCDCYFLCSSEHFAKVHFATISITFVKPQANQINFCAFASLSTSSSSSSSTSSSSPPPLFFFFSSLSLLCFVVVVVVVVFLSIISQCSSIPSNTARNDRHSLFANGWLYRAM